MDEWRTGLTEFELEIAPNGRTDLSTRPAENDLYVPFEDEEIVYRGHPFAYVKNKDLSERYFFAELSSILNNWQNMARIPKLLFQKMICQNTYHLDLPSLYNGFRSHKDQELFVDHIFQSFKKSICNGKFWCKRCMVSYGKRCDFVAHIKSKHIDTVDQEAEIANARSAQHQNLVMIEEDNESLREMVARLTAQVSQLQLDKSNLIRTVNHLQENVA